MFSNVNNHFWSLLLAVSLCLLTQTAQEPLLLGARDPSKEDQVATLFETIRSDSKLPSLTRIKHRESLEQRICTIAQTGTPGEWHSSAYIAYYKTAHPESITDDLTKVASLSKHLQKKLSIARYSVAVWRVTDSQTGEAIYWVGVALFSSAFAEFMDDHFTDDISYHNEWKRTVAPQCRNE